MKYAYQVTSCGDVVFCSGDNIIFWKELLKDDFDSYINARKNGQIVYQDKKGNLQISDKKNKK